MGRVKVTRVIGLLLDGEIVEGEGEIVAPALAMREFHATSDEKLHVRVGDPVYFHFESSKDAYLTLLNVGAEGEITILFPNEYMPFNRVVANKTYTLPTPEMGFDLHLGGPPGQELVKAFATEFPLDLSTLNTKAVGGFRTLDFDMAWEKHSPSVVDGLVSTINTSFNNNMSEGTRAIMLSANKEEIPPVGTPTGNWSTDYLIIDAR